MRRLFLLLALAAVTVMTGCATKSPSLGTRTHSGSGSNSGTVVSGKTKPYRVMGRTYYPLTSAAGYDEVGTASWYGRDFHGNKTASGSRYNMYGVSAAHKTLPLGSRVRVTNLENQRTVVLEINDRGPFVRGRIIDLSYGAARQLNMVNAGVARVRVTALSGGSTAPVVASASKGEYYHVRVGAFAEKTNAQRNYNRLLRYGYKGAVITTVRSKGRRLYVVQAGSFTSRTRAEQVRNSLRELYPSTYITR